MCCTLTVYLSASQTPSPASPMGSSDTVSSDASGVGRAGDKLILQMELWFLLLKTFPYKPQEHLIKYSRRERDIPRRWKGTNNRVQVCELGCHARVGVRLWGLVTWGLGLNKDKWSHMSLGAQELGIWSPCRAEIFQGCILSERVYDKNIFCSEELRLQRS